jgi:nitronate monooxygenase
MNFGSGGNQEAKAWKDIWGCGQGIGAVKSRMSTAEYVAQLSAEYEASINALQHRRAFTGADA